jgi:hypothetical protein
MSSKDDVEYDDKYLNVEWFHQMYVFHPNSLTAKEVWDELTIKEKQKIVTDFSRMQ